MIKKCLGCSFYDYCDGDFNICDYDDRDIADMLEEIEDWSD